MEFNRMGADKDRYGLDGHLWECQDCGLVFKIFGWGDAPNRCPRCGAGKR